MRCSGRRRRSPNSEEDAMKINPKVVIKLVKIAVQIAEVIINKK